TYEENLFRTTMLCLFWVVLILFSLVKTKIVHYSSLCWLPLTFLSAYAIESITNHIFKLKIVYTLLIAFIGLLLSAIVFAIPYMMMYHKGLLMKNIKDDFAISNIAANVHVSILAGCDAHHMAEGVFKALARALDVATSLDPRVTGVPSTKGKL
ncbi:MAG: hypothetical protein WEB60_09385, partial [Terrimicrobiaceae bacterium]